MRKETEEEVNRARLAAIWTFCLCTVIWIIMVLCYDAYNANRCEATPGCGTHIIDEFPEGHGR
jgi:hypothetical protein